MPFVYAFAVAILGGILISTVYFFMMQRYAHLVNVFKCNLTRNVRN